MSKCHEMFKTPILALVYSDATGADLVLTQLALALIERDVGLAGLVQHNAPRHGRSRCDMVLEDLASSQHVAISQDRGPEARGCMLDVGQLLAASLLVEESLSRYPDLVILNKFGKSESEGGGFRPLIAKVIESECPLVIAVPWRNIDSWRAFVGPLAKEVVFENEAQALAAIMMTLGFGPNGLKPEMVKPSDCGEL